MSAVIASDLKLLAPRRPLGFANANANANGWVTRYLTIDRVPAFQIRGCETCRPILRR